MCGITGFLGASSSGSAVVADRMASALYHRGPDDSGVWVDESAGVTQTHRRLSILDLSPARHQPMVSVSGRYVLVFKKEKYNHLELRKELTDCVWLGHSDTETLLSAFEQWGVEATLKKSVGMFSLALWVRESRTLNLARDRLGEKPLNYGCQNGVLLFGS